MKWKYNRDVLIIKIILTQEKYMRKSSTKREKTVEMKHWESLLMSQVTCIELRC